mgnify:CR=1 FL=1
MDSPDYMVLNPMRIIIIKIPKQIKLLGEIPYYQEINEYINRTKLKKKIPLLIDV